MAKDAFRIKKGTLHITPVDAFPADPELGDIIILSTDSRQYRYDGTSWIEFVDESSSQTLTNKEIDADQNTLTNVRDANIASDAAIEVSKLEALTANKLANTDATGVLEASGVTIANSTELSDITKLTAASFYGTEASDASLTGSLQTLATPSSHIVRLTNAGLVSLAGITAPSASQFFILTNASADTFDVINDEVSVAAGSKIFTGTNGKIRLQPTASLWLYYDVTSAYWRVVGGSGAGEGGVVKARLHNAISTSLPTGNPVTVDGVQVNAGDRVLFTALLTDNNRVYEAVGTGTDITSWLSLDLFNLAAAPASGDLVAIAEGDSFGAQLGTFDATSWSFNNKVRYFNGVDYWEQSSLNTVLLSDNQVAPADIFSISGTGSENLVIEYSIIRGTNKDIGTLIATHNGTTLQYATYGANVSDTGVLVSADLNAGNVRLRYTSTNTGVAPTIKYLVKRWSDSGGGPGSLPSYSITGTNVGGSGTAGQLAVWNSSTDLTGYTDLAYDSTNGVLSIGSGSTEIERTRLSSATLVDNTSGQLVFQLPHADYQFLVIEYSVQRSTDRSVGTLYITTNGTSASIAPTFTDLGSPGVTFTADVVGSNVRLLANTTATGSSANLKYAMKRWI